MGLAIATCLTTYVGSKHMDYREAWALRSLHVLQHMLGVSIGIIGNHGP